ncbi:hypothetical protein [Lentzea aerocolonigenes]|uniref:hypothetical protein n=1 Tax=Lentzea aerocolonigenes TaxID=68170 RepID=UPI0012E0D385|nr:hypothetical protein [Lentzea aerocolonigenes]
MTTITVTLQDDDPEVLEQQVRLLRDEVRDLDADVDLAPGPPAPEDAKGDLRMSHTIVVTDMTSPVLAELGRVLAAFADRGGRKIVVRDGDRTMEIQGPLDDTARQAVESFFRKELE